MTDLEQLSRDAAKVLTSRERIEFYVSKEGYQGSQNIVRRWLHESTEACAEIYVRKLRGHTIKVSAIMDTLIAGGVEEMQAFRTAVLRALIEVKK